VIDAPGGGGKIPLLPEYVAGHEGNNILLRNYEGNIYRYHDVAEGAVASKSKELATGLLWKALSPERGNAI
jgi:lysine 2,3-aminomutase